MKHLLLLSLVVVSAACGDNKGAASGDDTPPVDSPTATSQYALATVVFGPSNDSTMTYVNVLDSLDVASVDLTKAFPFPGNSDIATYGGKLFVASADAPTIERFSYANGKLTSEGVLSLANLGVDSAGLRANVFVSATKAYMEMPDGSFEVWNPSDMSLVKNIPVPDLDRGEALTLDGSPPVLRGNKVYRTYYWEDWSTYTFPAEQYFATFDTDTDTLVSKVSSTTCPSLGAQPQTGEDGTIYFSNWYYNVPGVVMTGAQKSCTARLPVGTDTIDAAWKLQYSDVDGGHDGAQLSYVANGKAVFAAFHQEQFTITADTQGYDLTSAKLWEVWGVDLASHAAAPVAGVDYAIADQGVFQLDGRTFLLITGADYASMQAYELNADGTARKAFALDGWTRLFLKLK